MRDTALGPTLSVEVRRKTRKDRCHRYLHTSPEVAADEISKNTGSIMTGVLGMGAMKTANVAMNGLVLAVLAIASLQASPIRAENYAVNLTRKGSNVYKIDGKDVFVQTRYCYVYAYSEEAILKTSGYGGEVVFLDSDDECDVKAVFGKAKQNPGNYAVTVSRDDDDWYEVFGTDSYLKTSMCLSLALGEEAYLKLSAGGYGELLFKDGDSCMVEGIYSKLRL